MVAECPPGRGTFIRPIGMATARYKFRLGDYQAVTLRCDASCDGLRCRVRGRLGRVQWATELRVTERQIAAFLKSVEGVVANLTGAAELNVSGDGRLRIRVSVDLYGAIQTEYDVTGWGGGLRRSQWHASGSYLCWPQHYLKKFPSGEPAAG